MKKIVLNYLNSIDETNYSSFDRILLFYSEGLFHNALSVNHATEIEFFPSIKPNKKSIQVYFNYYNLCAIFDFKEEWYEYCKYKPGCSAEELENSIIKVKYEKSFTIETFIQGFIKELDNDLRLVKTKQKELVSQEKKQKRYQRISTISLCVSFFVIAALAIYSFVADTATKLNPWLLSIIFIPLAIWSIFDIKSKRK